MRGGVYNPYVPVYRSINVATGTIVAAGAGAFVDLDLTAVIGDINAVVYLGMESAAAGKLSCRAPGEATDPFSTIGGGTWYHQFARCVAGHIEVWKRAAAAGDIAYEIYGYLR